MNSDHTLLEEELQEQWERRQQQQSQRRLQQLRARSMRQRWPSQRGVWQPLRMPGPQGGQQRSWRLQLPAAASGRSGESFKADAYLQARFTFSNTHLNLRSEDGRTILKFSAGNFKAGKKSSPLSNYSLGRHCGSQALEKGIQRVFFECRGLNRNRKILFKGLKDSGLQILRLTLKPSLAHNGCRPRRRRRL